MYLDFHPLENFYWSMFIFTFGLIFSIKFCDILKINYKYSLFLYFWHLLFCFIYFIFILKNGGDAVNYFKWALTGERDFGLGTGFIVGFNKFFIDYLKFSFIDLFLLYNFFGYIGFLLFASTLNKAVLNKSIKFKLLAKLLIILPSLSFWTCAIGKDSLAFLAICMALWAAVSNSSKKTIIIFSISILLSVRPHIAFVMLIAFIFSMAFEKKIAFYARILIGVSVSIFSIILIPVILNYVGLQDANDINDISDYVDKRQSYNLDGGSSLDISSMSLPMQMFTYLFRPLPFEAHSLFALLASIDNIVLLILLILGLFSYLNRRRPSVASNRIFIWAYFLLSLTVLSMTTANLGIAMRQKWMIMPFLIFLMLSMIGKVKITNNEKKL